MKVSKSKLSLISLISLLVFILFITSSLAAPLKSQSMTLLAVSEGGSLNQSVGATASVTLEIVSGTGRIFINTYPFAKIDTQVSVRLANEVACDFLEIDCNQYDFIYSIKTGSSTIGGPSAGAALAALTVATLDGQIIDEKSSISGTINSGGVVGAVGGLKEKISAAADLGITKVLIPLGERYVLDKDVDFGENLSSTQNNTLDTNESNSNNSIKLTLPLKTDLTKFGEVKSIKVVETGTLAQVLFELTGKEYEQPIATIEPPLYYTTQMKKVARDLCGSAQNLLDTLSVDVSYANFSLHIDNETEFSNSQLIILKKSNIDLVSTLNTARQLLNTSKNAYAEESYYAAASYCYGASLNLRLLTFLNMTPESALEIATRVVNSTNIDLSQYRTLTDLQTYMLVDERIAEANEHLADGKKFMEQNKSVLALNSFAAAIERANSAKLWSSFFSTQDNEITLNLDEIEESCRIKIQEATERQNLIGYYIDDVDIGTQLLSQAQEQLGKNPILCLFAASKAKASYDVVLSSLGLTGDVFNETFASKSQIAARVISKQFSSGAFPIIGYSYYEYAQSLASTDQNAALLYIQYALELSNLDAYLSTSKSSHNLQTSRKNPLGKNEIFVLGIALGLLLGVTIVKIENTLSATKNKSNKKNKLKK